VGRDHRRRGNTGIRPARPAAAGLAAFRQDVVAGLSLPQKALAPKHFYDAAGSRLFERICRLPEYYLTRAELALTRAHLGAVARFAGRGGVLLEYGSGESLKTRLLLRAMRPAVYMPVDISADALEAAVRKLAREFPRLRIAPVLGDFMRPLALPALPGRERRTVYFPGSTIGNLTPQEAQAFLKMTRGQVGARGAMLVGVDLKKDANILHAAYNDRRGVTAAFNLNLLARINRELGADFDLRRFSHYAFYNAPLGRIEMHLVSLRGQTVNVGEHRFAFAAGESIHTENSYKYAVAEFQALAAQAGFRGDKVWMDRKGLFALHGLTAD
jgi:dimethylhistidine N-methyltransferase